MGLGVTGQSAEKVRERVSKGRLRPAWLGGFLTKTGVVQVGRVPLP